jgi:hypothetical protein
LLDPDYPISNEVFFALTSGIWIDLPVLVHRVTAKENGTNGSNVSGGNQAICDMDSDAHIDQAGSNPLLTFSMSKRKSQRLPASSQKAS